MINVVYLCCVEKSNLSVNQYMRAINMNLLEQGY